MAKSKHIWSSPELKRTQRIQTATHLSVTSVNALRLQVFFFCIIILELVFNFILKLMKTDHETLFMYKLICKTLLSLNIIFMVLYLYQVIYSKFIIYVESRENKSECIIKSVLCDFVPYFQLYYEQFIGSTIYIFIFGNAAKEEEIAKAKRAEEVRKALTKGNYFQALQSTFNSYNDSLLLFNPNLSNRTPSQYLGTDSVEYFHNSASFRPNSTAVSTPYGNKLVTVSSLNFGSVTPIQYLKQEASVSDMMISPFQLSNNNNIRYPLTDVSINHFQQYNHQYQPSTPSPTKPHNRFSPMTTAFGSNNTVHSLHLSESPINEVWKRLDVRTDCLDEWVFNLRQWIHQTILNRIVEEIDKLNQKFRDMGYSDVAVGESNVQTLRHMASLPGNNFPTLSVLINFIDCSKDQGYIVSRIKELAQGRCLGQYRWDGGSTGGRHPWKEHLPNDTMLILHLLSTYIDCKNMTHCTAVHSVRTFSQQFIIDSLENKDVNDLKDACVLYQTSVQPPHFKMILDHTIFDMQPGRKHLFECLLVFLYKVYRNEGNFRWLNLGRSGLNLNWIFDEIK